MVTTTDNINEPKPTSGSKASGMNKDDAKAMLADYEHGKSVATLAIEYGYSEADVQASVVKPADEPIGTDVTGKVIYAEKSKEK